jgi:hypothetical protein
MPEQLSVTKEVLKTFGLAIGGLFAIGATIALGKFLSEHDLLGAAGPAPSSVGAVKAEINAFSSNCAQGLPLEVTLTNLASEDVLSTMFSVQMWDLGHSTKYSMANDSNFVSDRIIPPLDSYSDCYPMPHFSDALSAYLVESPQFEVIVKEVRFATD